MALISWIKSIGGGLVEGVRVGSEGGWGVVGGVKQTLKHKWQCYAISR